MKKIFKSCAIGVFVLGGIVFAFNFSSAQGLVSLTVPYIKEVPAGTSGGPWKNGCEEASMAMLEQFYTGKKVMNLDAGKAFMIMLFNKEDALYGSNVNSDTDQVKYLVENYSDYNAKIVNNPTIAQIKSEIDAGRPVITPHYGFALHNPNIPFLRTGTSYHMEVIIGYDDAAQQFIVNDSGDTVDGQGYRYNYDVFMNSIHDYSYQTKKANGPARAVFTYPKLVKVAGSPRIYYLSENTAQYVTAPSVFTNHGWKWAAVNIVSKAWFATFNQGAPINK
jgi:Peptidase_C39 like family